jgi:hypothetical protein
MTSIVSNDEPSMVEEDVESDKNDDLQILIGQTLATLEEGNHSADDIF